MLALLVGIGLIGVGSGLGVATDMLDTAITVGTAGMVLAYGGLGTA